MNKHNITNELKDELLPSSSYRLCSPGEIKVRSRTEIPSRIQQVFERRGVCYLLWRGP